MNTLESTTTPAGMSAPTPGPRKLAVAWARGTGIALMLVSGLSVAQQALGESLLVAGADRVSAVTLVNIFGMALLGGSIGAILAYLTSRWTQRPRATFLTICAMALAGYAVVPFLAAETVSTALWLNAFHLVVAIPVVGLLARTMPKARA